MRKYIFVLGCMFFLLAFAPLHAATGQCRDCHTQTTLQWLKSQHAHANENPLYHAMLDVDPNSSENECTRCHNPVVALNLATTSQDSNTSNQCDVCHAFKIEHKKNQYRFVPSAGKTGPFKDAVSTVHESEFAPEMKKSGFCLACHSQTTDSHGIGFIDVEAEWRNSDFYQQNIQCQDCHMPTVAGITAPEGKKRKLSNHSFPGGYLAGMVRACITMNSKVVNQGDDLLISISLVNDRAGHAVPTASPFRMIVLTIEALDENSAVIWKNYRYDPVKESPNTVFARILQDDRGNAPAFPWKAVGERFDSRLLPNVPRDLKFSAPARNIHAIHISLDYYPMPQSLARRLNITEEKFSQPINIASNEIHID